MVADRLGKHDGAAAAFDEDVDGLGGDVVGLGPGFGGGGGGVGVSIDPPSPRPNPPNPSTLEPFIFLPSSPSPLFPEKVASGQIDQH